MAQAISTSWALHPLHLLLLLAATSDAAMINITNRCSYTVWPGARPGGGVQLDPGESWMLDVPAGASYQIWPRTGCSFDANGNGSCQTGDCGGLLACKIYGRAPITMAEYTIGKGSPDFFDISLVDGFNVPMSFLPVPKHGGPACTRGPRCAANITSQCPEKLQAPGGCNSACRVFNQDKYCCNGTVPSGCEPTTYSLLFVRMCPDAYSYSLDDSSSTSFTCPTGINYQVVFCPPIDLTASPPNPPDPIATAHTSMGSSSNKGGIVGAILGSIVGFISIFAFILFIVHRRRTRRHQEMEEEEEEFGNLQGTPIRFTFKQLEVATEQFRDKLGEGGFGSVFNGRLGEERIAVKRLDRAGQGKREFLAEVQTISSIHHINLVRLIGFCAEKSHRLLVYEYMPRGSLDR